MELIDQHTKRIMEGCKERARAAGLRFDDETLEYIVTNRDLLELSPKLMIPTLYDYWVHDVEVMQEKGRYELYPNNPYETVINTRPAISFYNDNNPDWLNVMIFYHVLAHVDFFQNNQFFRHTWGDDFAGAALSDKRMIAALRAEKGRWVDYVIEFARGIDNLVGHYEELARLDRPPETEKSKRLDYYFDVFLQSVKRISSSEYVKEIERYNQVTREHKELADELFFAEVTRANPEFEALFRKSRNEKREAVDLLQLLAEASPVIKREENRWMAAVLQVVRHTSLFFQPQIRTKILNEGWASFWHERLFLQDDRIRGNEVSFARVNALVTELPRVGLNPYALGMRLFSYLEEMADRGAFGLEYDRLRGIVERKRFDAHTGSGNEFIFKVRSNYNDFMAVNSFVTQDFVDCNRLFVAERRLNESRRVWEYSVKSRRAEDYRKMLVDSLYHPPSIHLDSDKSRDGSLYLVHTFEGKPLVTEYIQNTLLGIEFLWGAPVKLETSELVASTSSPMLVMRDEEAEAEQELEFERVLYTMKDRVLSRETL